MKEFKEVITYFIALFRENKKKKQTKIRNKAMNRDRDKGSFDKAAPTVRSSSTTQSPFIHSTYTKHIFSLPPWEKQQTQHERCE